MATQADQTNTGVIFTVVVVGAFATLSGSLLLAALVRGERREVDAVRPQHADLETVAALKASQRLKMSAPPAWKSKAQKTVTLPIKSAMKLVLAEYTATPESASPQIPDGFRLTPKGDLVPLTGVQVSPAGAALPGAAAPVMAASGTAAPAGTQAVPRAAAVAAAGVKTPTVPSSPAIAKPAPSAPPVAGAH